MDGRCPCRKNILIEMHRALLEYEYVYLRNMTYGLVPKRHKYWLAIYSEERPHPAFAVAASSIHKRGNRGYVK